MFGYEERWGRLAVDTGRDVDRRAVGRRARTLHAFTLTFPSCSSLKNSLADSTALLLLVVVNAGA